MSVAVQAQERALCALLVLFAASGCGTVQSSSTERDTPSTRNADGIGTTSVGGTQRVVMPRDSELRCASGEGVRLQSGVETSGWSLTSSDAVVCWRHQDAKQASIEVIGLPRVDGSAMSRAMCRIDAELATRFIAAADAGPGRAVLLFLSDRSELLAAEAKVSDSVDGALCQVEQDLYVCGHLEPVFRVSAAVRRDASGGLWLVSTLQGVSGPVRIDVAGGGQRCNLRPVSFEDFQRAVSPAHPRP